MPLKYHIHTEKTPPRFPLVGKFAIIDFNENCAGACHNCVKKKCVYDNYKHEREFMAGLDSAFQFHNGCMNCLMCVQNCTRAALTRLVNPEYKRLGDLYWTAEMITKTWAQAETGNLPVSGAGYRGMFSGPGFDSMWTDMSEIVRPTRDGIHGREYISTSVDLGAKLNHLSFTPDGQLASDAPENIEIPVPFIFTLPHFGDYSIKTYEAFARAAAELDTLLAVPAALISPTLAKYSHSIAPGVMSGEVKKFKARIRDARAVALTYDESYKKAIAEIAAINPDAIVIMAAPVTPDADVIAERLARDGVAAVCFFADMHGVAFFDDGSDEFIKDSLRRVHNHLVAKGLRDSITIIAEGGIALPEHMAKSILCGADLVAVNIPFLVALECRMCMRCQKNLSCPVDIAKIDPEWGKQRIVNLSAAWRNQMLELLGAMGIREVRRLRGEFGRAIFKEDLERDTFQKIFAPKKAK